MEYEELKLFIPSETVRKYVMDTGWTFTDKEKAALLCIPHLLWKEKCSRLSDLADRTADEELRGQITAYLEWEERAMRTFRENTGGKSIYVLMAERADEEDEPAGYFADWERAYESGKKEKIPFEIRKYQIDDVTMDDDGMYSQDSLGFLRCDKEGEVRCAWSYEIPDIYDSIGEWNEHFSEMYFEVPNPFEKGDIIKTCAMGYYGIVEMSQKDWKASVDRYKKRLQQGGRFVDYTDIQIGITLFNEEDGTFLVCDDATPLDLERYEPSIGHEDWNVGTMDVILTLASELCCGKGYLSSLFYYIEKYNRHRDRHPAGRTGKKDL